MRDRTLDCAACSVQVSRRLDGGDARQREGRTRRQQDRQRSKERLLDLFAISGAHALNTETRRPIGAAFNRQVEGVTENRRIEVRIAANDAPRVVIGIAGCTRGC